MCDAIDARSHSCRSALLPAARCGPRSLRFPADGAEAPRPPSGASGTPPTWFSFASFAPRSSALGWPPSLTAIHASFCTTPGVPVSPPARHRSPLPMQVDRPGPWITADTKILMSTPGPPSLWQGWLTTSRGGSFMDAAGHHMRTGFIAKSAVDVTLGTSGSKTTCPARGGPPLSWGLELHAPERAHANAKMHVSNTDAP